MTFRVFAHCSRAIVVVGKIGFEMKLGPGFRSIAFLSGVIKRGLDNSQLFQLPFRDFAAMFDDTRSYEPQATGGGSYSAT